jgi:hypothetical protein
MWTELTYLFLAPIVLAVSALIVRLITSVCKRRRPDDNEPGPEDS